MIDTRTFDNSLASVRKSRRFVASGLGGADFLDVATTEAVILIVSELATNCVRHAATDFVVTIEIDATARFVRVEVIDDGRGRPELCNPSPADPSGRGLQIAASLSDDWGSTATAAGGNVVWFTVRQRSVDAGQMPPTATLAPPS
jgi:two-component sensor histidine kinase